MDNDYGILSIYVVFGILIIVGYIKLVIKYKKDNSKLWSNDGKNKILRYKWLKYLYMVMIFISFVATIYLIYYLTSKRLNQIDKILIYLGSVIFLSCSLIWAFRPFMYSKIVLGFASIGTLIILAGISDNISKNYLGTEDSLALISILIVIIQTGIFDFIIWNGF